MMHLFLSSNRDVLIERCKAKVAARPQREATVEQLSNGVPMFLDQLIRTLVADEGGRKQESLDISGGSGGDSLALSQIGVSATTHGASLLRLGYTVDQVVHDYGDLCQAITGLALERDAPFAVAEFRTLNRCLDNAIADAVLEFSSLRDAKLLDRQIEDVKEQVGFVIHELRNALSTAKLAVGALEHGNLNIAGATGAVLKRSLDSIDVLINRAVGKIRDGQVGERQLFSVASFIADAEIAANLEANARGCRLSLLPVDVALGILANRALLQAALANLLQNAFKFSHAHAVITLSASVVEGQVHIEVHDRCGGLPRGSVEKMFRPFTQHNEDRSGLGLGLAVARNSVEADFGTLTVRDVPGTGCVFTIALPLHPLCGSARNPE